MDGNISKRHLKNMKMYVKHVEKQCKINLLRFTWNLPDFFKQEKLAVYASKTDRVDINLNLKREKNSFVVTIDTNKFKAILGISCCVLSNGTYVLTSTSTQQVSKNIYQFSFPPPDFKYLKECIYIHSDSLELQFDIIHKQKQFFYSGNYARDYSRFVELANPEIVFKRCLTDFKIETNEGFKVYCLKSLLAARSKFFRNYFNESNNNKNEIQISSPIRVLCDLKYYVYTGCLKYYVYTKNVWAMLHIINLAWELDIPSLKTSCSNLIWSLINSDNVHEIRNEGIRSGLAVLVEYAEKFLENMSAVKRKESRKTRRCR